MQNSKIKGSSVTNKQMERGLSTLYPRLAIAGQQKKQAGMLKQLQLDYYCSSPANDCQLLKVRRHGAAKQT